MKYAKHIHVLQLLSTIPVGPITQEDATSAFDHLFEYIHANWAIPVACDVHIDGPDCRAMLDMSLGQREAMLESLPPYFRESIFPVAVACYLLRNGRLPVNHRISKTFIEFHTRYGRMILSTYN